MTDCLWNFDQYYPEEENKLGDYLKNTGQPLNCRLDLRITRLEELKKAAVIISELNKTLQHYAYEAEGDPVLRVLMARDAIEAQKIKLKYWRAEATLKAVQSRKRARRGH